MMMIHDLPVCSVCQEETIKMREEKRNNAIYETLPNKSYKKLSKIAKCKSCNRDDEDDT